jgi:nitrite reductase (NO-forming)
MHDGAGPETEGPLELMSPRTVAVFAVSLVLAIAGGVAVGVAIWGVPTLPRAPEAPAATRQVAPTQIVTVGLAEFTIDADPGVVSSGSVVEFVVTNHGTVQHDFKVNGTVGVDRLDPGTESRFQIGPVREAMTAWCTILGHRESGMEVTISITNDE